MKILNSKYWVLKSFTLVFLCISTGTYAQNLVSNPGFEAELTNWYHNYLPGTLDPPPEASVVDEDVSGEKCLQGKCLELFPAEGATMQTVSQDVSTETPEPGKNYLFSARFKTSASHYGYILLKDLDWKDSDGNIQGKKYYKAMPGTGEWETIESYFYVPETDERGETTGDDEYKIFLYGHLPTSDLNPVYYDDVALVENLVSNPGFEEEYTNWTFNNIGIKSLPEDECEHGTCLELSPDGSNAQYVTQLIGTLAPDKQYRFSARFKTSYTHYGYILLKDLDWKDSDCNIQGKKYLKTMQGTGEWETLESNFFVPENDGCGSTDGHRYRIFLYGHYPVPDEEPVYYDDVILVETSLYPQSVYTELEEEEGWISQCEEFSDAHPLTSCSGFSTHGPSNPISESSSLYSLKLTGTKENKEAISLDLAVKPDQLYKVSFSLKYNDRVVYNYLDPNLNYPSLWTEDIPEWRDTVERTKGIWSGIYDVLVDETSVLQPQAKDAEYRSWSDMDWWSNETYFRTKPGQVMANIKIMLTGFKGELLIDNLRVEEVETIIDDKYLQMEIPEYGGMRIEEFSANPLYVQTNNFKFSFSPDSIVVTKDGETVSEYVFPNDFLSGLNGGFDQGNVYLANDNIALSIGADSVLIGKLIKDSAVSVRGPKPEYVVYQAGTIFATDLDKGQYFAPIRSQSEVNSMPFRYDEQYGVYSYDDEDFEKQGIKFWNLEDGYGFDSDEYRVDYDLESGRGFIAQMMPPKDFDPVSSCKKRVHTVNTNIIQNPDADFSYMLERVSEDINIPLVWMSAYASSVNDMNFPDNPPDVYCKDAEVLSDPAGKYVHCGEAGAYEFPVTIKTDVTGPYAVGEPAAFIKLVKMIHDSGEKVILYMSPKYYYTSDVDKFLENVEDLLEQCGDGVCEYIDGIYFDGMYSGDILRTIELARKTRALLGDKIYVQHDSRLTDNIYLSDKVRNPAADAWADIIYVGERVKYDFVDDDRIWNLMYNGVNVGNTPTVLLPEIRRVDYFMSAEDNLNREDLLSPEDQVNKTLMCLDVDDGEPPMFCQGGFMIDPYSETSYTQDKNFQIFQYFETDNYTDKLNSYCLDYTCGDGVCDVGERIFSCPQDCAPTRTTATLEYDGGGYYCNGEGSVVQWIVNNEPFYNLHYTFDEHPARDESGYNNSIDHHFGIFYDAPQSKDIDGRDVFHFDGTGGLFGDGDESLDMTGKDFSSFAVIKPTTNEPDMQTVFSLNQGQNFYYGVQNGQAIVYFAQKGGVEEIVESTGCPEGENCLRTVKNGATWQGTSQVLPPLEKGDTYKLSALFKTSSSRKGDVSVFDVDCGTHYRTIADGNDINEWGELTTDFTVPDDTEHENCGNNLVLYLYSLSSDDANSELFYDQVALVKIDESGNPISGNIIQNPGFEQGFTGWAHNSTTPIESITETSDNDIDIVDDNWHTIGIIYDKPELTLFVDGVSQGQKSVYFDDFERLGEFGIGTTGTRSAAGATEDNFNGYIDDLFLADEALTTDQVMQYHDDLHKHLTIQGSPVSCVLSDDDGEIYSPEPQ